MHDTPHDTHGPQSASDASARRAAEEALGRTRFSVDRMRDAIYWITPEARFLDVNDTACAMLGFTREELLRMGVPDIDPGHDLETFGKVFARTRSEGALVFETVHQAKDGRRIPVECSVHCLRYGEQEFLVAMARDISVQKRMAEELLLAKGRSEQANRAKSEFLANMSHEVRTPLNGVMGMLQLALETGLSAEQHEYVSMALESGRNLLRVLNDVLDLSRIEAGKFEIREKPFAPRPLLDSIAALFRAELRGRDITLSLAASPTLPTLLTGDEVRIRQVLFNLVGNAVKFTPRGTIGVELGMIHGHPRGPLLYGAVSDTGIGIPGEKLSEIFEAFAQADGTYTRRYQGAGLGLSIVRRLVNLMGGTISVESEPGAGTTVHFTIRVSQPPAQAAREAPAVRPDADVSALTILLAEDERLNRRMTGHMLERRGHRVLTAENGVEVLETLAHNDVDVVLMDIQMPVMDGVEATRRIRSSEERLGSRAHVPIVALTAHAMEGDRKIFLDAGMDDYLAKPVEFRQLDETLSRVMRRKPG